MKYQVLIDYGVEGYKFMDGRFDTLDEAVKQALMFNTGHVFLIVQVVEWEAHPKETNQ